MVSHHPVKFVSQRKCGIVNINIPATMVILSQMLDTEFVGYL